MKPHKLAQYFPVLEGEEFDLLVEDIRKNGQMEPVVTYRGTILDGVNRARACETIGIPPMTEEYRGDDPLAYVVSLNIRRRHMDKSQRTMLATEMEPEVAKQIAEKTSQRQSESAKMQRPEGSTRFVAIEGSKDPSTRPHEEDRARHQTAKLFGVSGPSIQRAKRIKEKAPEKVKDIVSGKTTVTAVDSEIRAAEAAKHAEANRAKGIEKAVKEHPKAVKEYLDAMKNYRKALEFAMEVARRDRFSPEAMQFVRTGHDKIRALMTDLEGTT